jgi:ribosomal protein L11 methyltransferase
LKFLIYTKDSLQSAKITDNEMNVAWIQLKVNITREYADEISNALLEQGALSITYVDAKDQPVFEPKPGETPLWPEMVVMALWEADVDVDQLLIGIQSHPSWAHVKKSSLEPVEDKDWVLEWMDSFKPIHFGHDLWICPSWHQPPKADAVNVMLDPGIAFGTGTHPTTFLCMQWLAEQDLTGKSVIDFGCGSGILALAAKKLGAKRVIGTDIDPQALEATLANFERNGYSANDIELYLPEDMPKVEVDVMLANILASPLRQLEPVISGLTKSNGDIILSGILENQADDVIKSYQKQFTMSPPIFKEEWTRLTGIKN